ncbi:MAG: urease accessory protein UreF [Nitrososphaerales archaeon]
MSTEYSTDAADLSMMQLSDSFFPTGMYTSSNGLEAIYYSGRKKMNAAELRDLIKIFLEYQIGPADCTALGNAYEYACASDLEKLVEVDRTIFAMKLIQEIRSASVRSGTQLLRCILSFTPNNKVLSDYANAIKEGQAFGPYPVALAVAANAFSIPKRKAGIMMLYSFSVSIVGAALRLGMLQHFDGQRIIDELKPTISKTVESYINRPIQGIWQFAAQIDIIQIAHERMTSRMFIT